MGRASDDTHEYRALTTVRSPHSGQSIMVLRAPNLTLASITDAIRKGQFYACSGVALPWDLFVNNKLRRAEDMHPPEQHTLSHSVFIGENGKVLGEVLRAIPPLPIQGQ